MKKCYIGLGGFGCSLLKEFEDDLTQIEDVKCIYFDKDNSTADFVGLQNFFCYDPQKEKAIFDSNLPFAFFDTFFDTNEIEFVFLTSSFGEYGSKLVFDIAKQVSDFIEMDNLAQISIHIKIIAISHEGTSKYFSKSNYKICEIKTAEFLYQCRKRVNSNLDNKPSIDSTPYSSVCYCLVSDCAREDKDILNILLSSNEELAKIDCSEKFNDIVNSIADEIKNNEASNGETENERAKEALDEGYVFISYSSKNQSSADAMQRLLKKHGFKTWMAPNDIPAGKVYAQVITRAIRNCSCFILMLTKSTQTSNWIHREVERAINYGKPIISVKLEDVILNDDFEFYISTNQIVAVNKIDDKSEDIKKLLDGVKSFVKVSGEKKKVEVENKKNKVSQEHNKSKNTGKKIGIMILILSVIVLVGSFLLYYFSDRTPPVVTLSEPKVYASTVEFTVSASDETKLFSVDIDKDHVVTHGFTGDLEIIDNGDTQILKITNAESDTNECQITLLEGVAVDNSKNNSISCSSEIFHFDNSIPALMTIAPKEKNRIIKEGDTVVYSVAINDGDGILAASLTRENIIMNGFDAKIWIDKTVSSKDGIVWEVTFSNIKFIDDSTAKYFKITECVLADIYGNMNGPLEMYLRYE